MARLVLFIALWISLAKVESVLLDKQSFSTPFDAVGFSGARIIPNWEIGGSTEVNQNFIRMTPDRQSKTGYLWGNELLGSSSIAATLKFRISGQGKNFFGDGLALWLNDWSSHKQGQLHGGSDQFRGIAIIIDTFINSETQSLHKDIAILVNDGTKNAETMVAEQVGCQAKVRYWEGRDDFSVAQTSSIKLSIDGNRLTLKVDATSSGVWEECATIANLRLSNDWANIARFGITATTGGLADNHDVLGFTVRSGTEFQTNREEMVSKRMEQATKLQPGLTMDQQAIRLDGDISIFEEEIEHEMEGVEDYITNMVEKLRKREEAAEGRIKELERRLLDNVENTINPRVKKLEDMVNKKMNRGVITRISKLESGLGVKIKESVRSSVDDAQSGWITPFSMILCVIGAVAWYVYKEYQKYMKDNYL